ncbi:MAG: fibronectin type III domain-containing protein [Patescibacteria group bacterium]
MRIKTGAKKTNRQITRHYKRNVFLFIAAFGMLSGFIAQSAGIAFIQNNVFASNGWNWVNQNPGQMLEVSDVGILTQKAVSKDGLTVVYGSSEGINVSKNGGDTWQVYHPSTTRYYEYFTGVAVSANGQHIWIEAGYSDDAETFMSNDGGSTWTQTGDDTTYTDTCEYSGFVSNNGQIIVCNGMISRDSGATYDYLDYLPYSVTDDLQTMLADDYISTDAGVTWNPLATLPAVANLYYGSNSQISGDGETIILGSYTSYDWTDESYDGYEIIISEDGGQTWATRPTPVAVTHPGIRMSGDGQKLYLFDINTNHGGGIMYTSTDAGVSWQQRSTRYPYFFEGFSNVSVSDNGSVITAFTYSAATFRSEDSGATWSAHFERGGVTPVTISSDGDTIYGIVSLGGESNTDGLILPVYSTDNGDTWSSVLGDNIATLPAPMSVCTLDKSYGEASTNLSVSADGQVMIMPGITAAGTDCHLVSRNGGTTWSQVTGLINKNETNKIVVSKTGQHMVTVSRTTRKPIVSHDTAATWTQLASSYNFQEIQGMSDDGMKMTATTTSDVLLYSTNGGVSWTNISTVLTGTFTGLWGSDWRANVSGDGTRLLASDGGSDYVYISTNNGASWTKSTSQVTPGGNYNTYHGSWYVGQFSMSENGMRIGVSGTSGEVMTSLDGGVTFTKQDNIEGINFFWEINTLISADGSTFLSAREDAYLAVAKYGFNPQPIQGISATAGIESATISWTLASLIDPSDTVTAQQVQYRQVGQTNWTSASQAISPTATSYTVTGLTAGIQYEFKGRAQNTSGGWTPWARAYTPRTTLDISSIAPNSSINGDYALDATDGGDIWFTHVNYPCGNPSSCAANGWLLESSTDGGLTWQSNPLTGLAANIRTAVAKPHMVRVSDDGQTILLTGATMYISRDGGVTWSNVSSIGAGRWYTIDMSDNGQYMVASEWGGARQVSVSSDSGQTWTDVTLPYGNDAGDVAHVTVINNGTLYLSTYDWENPIIKSTNLGVSWAPASSNLPRALPMPSMIDNSMMDGYRDLAIVDMSNDEQHIVYVAAFGFGENGYSIRYVTENGGQDWVALSELADSTAFDPESLRFDEEAYDFSMAFTESGRSVYITGLTTETNYGIAFSNYSNAFAIPLAAAVVPVDPGSGGGGSGGSGGPTGQAPSVTPGAPNTAVTPLYKYNAAITAIKESNATSNTWVYISIASLALVIAAISLVRLRQNK